LQSTFTAPDETLQQQNTFDWQVQHDVAAYEWNFSTLPNDAVQPFSLPFDDFDLLSDSTNLSAFSMNVPEDIHISDYDPPAAPDSTSADSRSRSSPEGSKSVPASSTGRSARVEKRKANTLAARRYRQKRLDRVAELEAEVKKTQEERDDFKDQVLRLLGETELLKDLLRQSNKS